MQSQPPRSPLTGSPRPSFSCHPLWLSRSPSCAPSTSSCFPAGSSSLRSKAGEHPVASREAIPFPRPDLPSARAFAAPNADRARRDCRSERSRSGRPNCAAITPCRPAAPFPFSSATSARGRGCCSAPALERTGMPGPSITPADPGGARPNSTPLAGEMPG